MKIEVQLFAAAKEKAGTDRAELELPDSATVAALRQMLLSRFPDLEPIAKHLLFAINDDYATDDAPIPDGARVACFPPVSGG